MNTTLTPSEIAIVEEIVSARSIEELTLLGQRLEFLHTFSQYASFLVIALALFFVFYTFRLKILTNISQIITGVICLFIPAIPMAYLGEIAQLPLFAITGALITMSGLYHLIKDLSRSFSVMEDEHI